MRKLFKYYYQVTARILLSEKSKAEKLGKINISFFFLINGRINHLKSLWYKEKIGRWDKDRN